MIDFVGNVKKFITFSSVLLIIAVLFAAIFGVQLDIQFTGGVIATYSYTGEISAEKVQSVVESEMKTSATVQLSTDANHKRVVVSMSVKNGLTPETQEQMVTALQKEFPQNQLEVLEINSVEAGIGNDFFFKSLAAVGFAAVIIILYIAWRFKKISGWSAGVMAVVGLLHDVLMVFATFIILRIPINGNCMAVVLTILGYSINDTIVIYDRIRENSRLYGKKLTPAELVNKSINKSLVRSINTSLTTIMVMGSVGVVSLIYGVSSIVSFAFPMIVGMISGVYSSVCLSGPLWVVWQNHKINKSKNK